MTDLILKTNLPLVMEFLRNNLSVHTRRAYLRDLTDFQRFLKVKSIQEVTIADLIAYRGSIKHLSIASINRKLTCVKSYFTFLERNGALYSNPTKMLKLFPKPDNTKTNALSDSEAVAILGAIDTDTQIGKMHHALLSLLLFTALRREEATNLILADIQEDSGTAIIKVHGKGNRERVVPIPQNVKDSLIRYLKNRNQALGKTVPLFSAYGGKSPRPLSGHAVYKILMKYVTLAGIKKKVSPHSLRATCISNALENGASLIQAQYLGGWQSAEMVLRYDKRRQMIKNSAVFKVNYSH